LEIIEQARRLRIPVQIHTGELWGDTVIAETNPMHLKKTLQAFPDVNLIYFIVVIHLWKKWGFLLQTSETCQSTWPTCHCAPCPYSSNGWMFIVMLPLLIESCLEQMYSI